MRHPQTRATVSDVPLLVYTGADITILPCTAVERHGVQLLTDQQLVEGLLPRCTWLA